MTAHEYTSDDYASYPTGSNEYGGLLPHSEEAEHSVIGGLMLQDDPQKAWDTVIEEGVRREDFFFEDHRQLFEVIESLFEKNEPVDCVSVKERYVELFGPSDEMFRYIVALWQNTPTAANIYHYARTIKEKSNLRTLHHINKRGCELALEHGARSEKVVEAVDQAIFRFTQGLAARDFADLDAALHEVIDSIDADREVGLPTGLKKLDELLSGLKAGDLIILAARPGMGKTSLALGFGLENLIRPIKPTAKEDGASESDAPPQHRSVLIFSLEMTAKQLIERILSQVGKVSLQELRSDLNNQERFDRLTYALSRFHEISKRLVIDETGALTPMALRAKVRRAVRRFGMPCLIIVDYLQLMRSPGKKENRNLEISDISQALKALAKEMKCPVIALSQLNRSPEARASKRPVMSDLRDSGSLEQDADVIAFIYRDEVYNPESKDRGTAEIIVAKHRSGPTGVVQVAFVPEYTLFANLQPADNTLSI